MIKNPREMCMCVGSSLLKYSSHGKLIIIFSKEVKEMKGGTIEVLEEACSRQREQQVWGFWARNWYGMLNR